MRRLTVGLDHSQGGIIIARVDVRGQTYTASIGEGQPKEKLLDAISGVMRAAGVSEHDISAALISLKRPLYGEVGTRTGPSDA